MKKNKIKICVDCLHCKVSAKSQGENRLCYCAKSKLTAKHREAYWLTKKVCKYFDDMDG
jgi:hypothetical protein